MLDTLSHQQRSGLRGEGDDGPHHRRGRRPGGAALHEAEIDLDHVEAQLGEQPQPGVADTQIVGREADSCALAGLELDACPRHVGERLALGQLEHQAIGGKLVAGQDAEQARGREFG